MIQHVHQRCIQSGAFSRVLVATDDSRILDAVRAFGGEARLTSPDCASGTDRVAEIARALPEADVLVNVQGDEPLVDPESLRILARAFDRSDVAMATLARPLLEHEGTNPNVVKVVLALDGRALYFSRAELPFIRDRDEASASALERWAHVGLYGYRREVLFRLAVLPQSPLERSEKLEQLRALENGIPIHCLKTRGSGIGVDTPEDLARAEALLSGS